MRRNKRSTSENVKVLHPIESFGVLKAVPGEIRAERLQDRLEPRIPFPHRHDFFQITYICEGRGWHEIDFRKHKLSNNQVFFMKPGQVHSWTIDPRARGFIIEFTRESLPTEFSKAIAGFHQQLTQTQDAFVVNLKSEAKNVEVICEIMLQEFHDKPDRFEACLQSYLIGLLLQLTRWAGLEKAAETNYSTFLDRFKALVEMNYKKEHRVGFYAEALGLTPKSLTMQMSRTLGKPPRAIIQDRFLLEAKRLLSYSSLSVAEIGYELGFDDANYFTRFFRKHTKISPSEFRTKNRMKKPQ